MKSFEALKTKRFTCLQCGECCGAWNLPVEDDLYTRLINLEFVKNSLTQHECTFSNIDGQMCLPKKEGICIFFSQDTKLCGLQVQGGPELKPRECMRFPFAYAETIDGKIFADTSFYCKAVIRNEGQPVDNLLNSSYIDSFDKFKMPNHVLVTHVYSANSQQGTDLINFMSDYIYTTCVDYDIERWDTPLIKGFSVLKNISSTLIKTGFLPDFKDVKTLTFAGPKTIALKRTFFTGLILRKNSSIIDFLKIMGRKGEFNAPILAEIIDLSHVEAIQVVNNDETKEILLRYLLDIIDRKVLLAHGHSISSMYMALFAAYCLILWYARALASMEGESTAALFHIELAIRITERYYIGHNIRFMELFRHHKSFNPLNKFMAG